MAMRSAAWVVVLMVAPWVRGEERGTLELVWLDAHQLFADFERVRSEADPIFRDLGVTVRWEVGADPRPPAGDRRIHVVLMPSEPGGWGISPSAMGVVLLPERARQSSTYLFYPPILRNVGLGRKAGGMLNPRERRDVARALARVLVHEVIHAIAPHLSHADEGVMHDALLIGALSKSAIEIDDRPGRNSSVGFRSSRPLEPFSIGPWRVDPRKNVLERTDHRVRVEPKAMRVLVYLADRAGDDVPRTEILRVVRDGAPVKPEVLTNAIWELRKALGDDSHEPDFIQTVSRKGYRLVARVDRSDTREGALLKASGWLRAWVRG